ncbi:hypothetical protein Bbelb_344420 [Branchiostoma belcheri]|nr:hypothetical protein Bbelb_344420 [Branchiostoma belcheri]
MRLELFLSSRRLAPVDRGVVDDLKRKRRALNNVAKDIKQLKEMTENPWRLETKFWSPFRVRPLIMKPLALLLLLPEHLGNFLLTCVLDILISVEGSRDEMLHSARRKPELMVAAELIWGGGILNAIWREGGGEIKEILSREARQIYKALTVDSDEMALAYRPGENFSSMHNAGVTRKIIEALKDGGEMTYRGSQLKMACRNIHDGLRRKEKEERGGHQTSTRGEGSYLTDEAGRSAPNVKRKYLIDGDQGTEEMTTGSEPQRVEHSNVEDETGFAGDETSMSENVSGVEQLTSGVSSDSEESSSSSDSKSP